MHARHYLSSLLVSCAIYPSALADEKLPLEDCQHLVTRMGHMTELRRKGGSNADMRSWKRERTLAEEQYRKGRCKRWGRRLR